MKRINITLITTIIFITIATIVSEIETRINLVETPIPTRSEPVSAKLTETVFHGENESDKISVKQSRSNKRTSIKKKAVQRKSSLKKNAIRAI